MIFLSSASESIFQLIVVLIIFIGVLFASYYVTKWIAGYQKQSSCNRNLEIVEMSKLSADKSIQIVRAGKDKYFILALSKNDVTFIGELTRDELVEVDSADIQNNVSSVDFKSILERMTNKK